MDKKGKPMKIYIAGKITGEPRYLEKFKAEETRLQKLGCIVLNPALLPERMTSADYMRICFSMIDSADGVVLIPGWETSRGAELEKKYCEYIGKPVFCGIEAAQGHLERILDE